MVENTTFYLISPGKNNFQVTHLCVSRKFVSNERRQMGGSRKRKEKEKGA
jgi:hypothetical protein